MGMSKTTDARSTLSAVAVRRFACAIAVPAAVLLAGAPARAEAAKVNGHALGILESIQHFCAPLDKDAAARIDGKIKLVVQGATDQDLAAVRNGPEYLQAHSSMDDFISKVDERNAKRVCSQDVNTGK